MSKYTTEVRFICEQKAGLLESSGFNDVENILTKSWNKIFTKDWNIFNENYRSVLCKKILRHFYTREICAETVALWQLWLNSTMCEIMPYYNKLYESELLKFDVFNNVNITKNIRKTGNEKIKENGTNSSNSTANTTNNTVGTLTNSGSNTIEKSDGFSETNKFNDTPQGGLSDIENNKYLTDIRIIERDNIISQSDKSSNMAKTNESDIGTINATQNITNSNNKTSDSTENWIESITGKNTSDSNSKLLKEFRESFLNIDKMIIDNLENLFFALW